MIVIIEGGNLWSCLVEEWGKITVTIEVFGSFPHLTEKLGYLYLKLLRQSKIFDVFSQSSLLKLHEIIRPVETFKFNVVLIESFLIENVGNVDLPDCGSIRKPRTQGPMYLNV